MNTSTSIDEKEIVYQCRPFNTISGWWAYYKDEIIALAVDPNLERARILCKEKALKWIKEQK